MFIIMGRWKRRRMNKYTKIKDFHGSRLLGVGSSDIPILAGLTRQWESTPVTLYQDKKQLRPKWEGNERTEWGHKLEGLVLKEFINRRYGEDAGGPFKTNTEATHPERPYCLAHADLIVDEADHPETAYIVEAKTTGMMAGKRKEGKIFSGYDPEDLSAQGIPDAVFLQVQYQMYVYGVDLAYVAVLIDTADYREYGPIHADKKVQEKCLALAEKFWNCVQTSTPPAPETWEDVGILFPDKKNETTMISGEAEEKVKAMIFKDRSLAAKIKECESERDEIKTAIGVLIGENSVLASASGDVFATSGEQSRESISLKTIKDKAPEIEAKIRELGLVSVSKFNVLRLK